ncbi:MAG: tail fiber protein [Pseudomonadota bacterium]
MFTKINALAVASTIGLSALLTTPTAAHAQECMLAEMRLFAGNYAPRSWLLAHGQELAISQNEALFAVIGTAFGGNGRTTFHLPDMRGRVAAGSGKADGLTNRVLGKHFGAERTAVTLTADNLPPHTHPVPDHTHEMSAHSDEGDTNVPTGAVLADDRNDNIYSTGTPDTALSANAIKPGGPKKTGPNSGTAAPISVPTVPPSIALHHIICVQGLFPSRG